MAVQLKNIISNTDKKNKIINVNPYSRVNTVCW